MTIPFLKMNGLGNDFVVIDARKTGFNPSGQFLRAVANRRHGVGCDQIIIMQKPQSPQADVHMAIYNLDGTKVGACGNASRCIAQLLFAELGRKACVIETIAGLLPAWEDKPGMIAIDFGLPKLEWQQIPLAREADTLHSPVASGGLFAPVCVNVGNPHAVFFVDDVYDVALADVGARLENDPIFPERCNIEVAQVLSRHRIRMRVWERGSGVTEACGSGACATLVAAVRRGLSARRAFVVLDGGELEVEWRDDDHVVMMGAATLNYHGELADDFGGVSVLAENGL